MSTPTINLKKCFLPWIVKYFSDFLLASVVNDKSLVLQSNRLVQTRQKLLDKKDHFKVKLKIVFVLENELAFL